MNGCEIVEIILSENTLEILFKAIFSLTSDSCKIAVINLLIVIVKCINNREII